MKIIGLDLSLTSTGIAIIDGPDRTVQTITTKGSSNATLSERVARLAELRDKITALVWNADLVVIEGPSFGQHRQTGQHDRAGLWWLVVEYVDTTHRLVEVPPASRSKYATGRGNSPKDAVLAAVIRRYLAVEIRNNDEADALVLAAMGARHLGVPIEDSLPEVNLSAMNKVKWPVKPEGRVVA